MHWNITYRRSIFYSSLSQVSCSCQNIPFGTCTSYRNSSSSLRRGGSIISRIGLGLHRTDRSIQMPVIHSGCDLLHLEIRRIRTYLSVFDQNSFANSTRKSEKTILRVYIGVQRYVKHTRCNNWPRDAFNGTLNLIDFAGWNTSLVTQQR